MDGPEIPLGGGRTTSGVVRIGATVRRPCRENSPFIRSLLVELENIGFSGAHRWLGIDNLGRDVFSYVEGDVPKGLVYFPDETITDAARLIRNYHESTTKITLRGFAEVICHGDLSPCNVVFANARPIALIDFDTACPGSRFQDVGYAAWLWLDIGNDDLDATEQSRRLALFLEAYGALPMSTGISAIHSSQMELESRVVASSEVRAWASECRAWTERNWNAMKVGIGDSLKKE